MRTPPPDLSSLSIEDQLKVAQNYTTPEGQKIAAGYGDGGSSGGSSGATPLTNESPKIPRNVEDEMRRENMKRFMKRIHMKNKANSPETRERIERNRRNSVMGTGIAARKEIGKSTKDYFKSSSAEKFGNTGYNTPGGGSGAAFASSQRPELFKVDVAEGGHNRCGRRGSIMDVLDPPSQNARDKARKAAGRRKSCIDLTKETAEEKKGERFSDATPDKNWGLDGMTPSPLRRFRRASISVLKELK